MIATTKKWADVVLGVAEDVPKDLRWRVQVGLVQSLPAVRCRGCQRTRFAGHDGNTMRCLSCSTLTSADGALHKHRFVDLVAPRVRLRIEVLPLHPGPIGVVTATQWASEHHAGLDGPVPGSASRRGPLIEVEGTFSWGFAWTANHPRPNALPDLGDKILAAVLGELGCRYGYRDGWKRPDGAPVYRSGIG